MAKVVCKWKLQQMHDHLEEIASIVHDLKDLHEVVSAHQLEAVGFDSKRSEILWNLVMILKLFDMEP